MREKFFIGITVSAQLIGQLFLQLIIVKQLGVGKVTDAYIASQTAPLILFAIASTAIQSVWLPKLSVLINNNNELKSLQEMALGQALVVGGAILLFVGGTSIYWVSWVFPGFDSSQYKLIVLFNWFLLIANVFNLQSSLFTVFLRVEGKFLPVEVVSLVVIFVSLIAVYILLPIYGISSVIWITLFRSILIYYIQYKMVGSPKCNLIQGAFEANTWLKMLPLLLGTSIYKTSPAFDRYFASQATSGSMTILNLAQTSVYGLSTIFERVFITPLLPSISRSVENKEYSLVRSVIRTNLIRTLFLIVIVAGLAYLITPLFVMIACSYLNLTVDQANIFLLLFFCFLGFLHSAIFTSLLVSTYYAFDDTKTPAYIGILGFLVGISIKFYLFKLIGVYALPVATSIYTVLNNIFFYINIEIRLKRLILKQ